MARSKRTASPAADPAPAVGSPMVSFRPIEALIPYVRNARTHSAAQVAQIAASITEFGFTNPILADTNGIVAGHGRLMAARQLLDAGLALRLPSGEQITAGHVPVLDCTGWSDAQRRAYIIADNKLALNAGWDFDMLRIEIAELSGLGFDETLTGFSKDELAQLTLDVEEGDTNSAAEWSGMPEYEDAEPCFRKIVVNFDDQASVEDFFARMGQTCTDKTKSIWHPYKARRDVEALRYANDGGAEEPVEAPASLQ